MITIDLIDESRSRSEKPNYRTYEHTIKLQDKYYDPVRMLVENQRDDLLRAAHAARMLNTARRNGLAIDVQRYIEKIKVDVVTLVERYVRRLGYL